MAEFQLTTLLYLLIRWLENVKRGKCNTIVKQDYVMGLLKKIRIFSLVNFVRDTVLREVKCNWNLPKLRGRRLFYVNFFLNLTVHIVAVTTIKMSIQLPMFFVQTVFIGLHAKATLKWMS